MKSKKEDLPTTPPPAEDTGVKSLGQMLVEASLITEQQLSSAREMQRTRGGKLSEILVEQRFVSADDLVTMLSIQMNLPYIDLKRHVI